MAGNRRLLLVAGLVVIVAAGIGLAVSIGGHSGSKHPTVAPAVHPSAAERLLAREGRVVEAAADRVSLIYPTALDQPAPTWTTTAFDAPLPSHEVFGFVPYYSLGELSAGDYQDVTTMAYDGVSLAAGGRLDESSSDLGWAALSTPAFDTLVTDAHRAKDQVLLTVFTETAKVINSIARDPAASGTLLAQQLQPLLADNHLDGVDIDVEGSGKADRAGFVSFVRSFAGELRSTDPTAVIVLDVYPGSAGDPRSFFDVRGLAPLVDTLFVMAYDMYQPGRASPNAPLASPDLGLSDVQTVLDYVKIVPPSKLLLGVPFYGYDFTTKSGDPNAPSEGAFPEAVTWQSILAAGHQALWDPKSYTPWYRFKLHGKWHETYFDDPASIALKTALAADLHLAGVGVWSLGMESGDDEMLDALLGGSPPVKLKLTSSAVMSTGPSRPLAGRSA